MYILKKLKRGKKSLQLKKNALVYTISLMTLTQLYISLHEAVLVSEGPDIRGDG